MRAAEEAVRHRGDGPARPSTATAPPGASPARRLRPPGLLELEELLSAHLDTRVKIEMGSSKGRVLIEFATLEDLERLYRRMTEPADMSEASAT